MKLTRIAVRNIFRNGRRSILSIIAVSVCALTITIMFSLLEGIKADMERNSIAFETGEVRIRHRDFDRYEHLLPVQYVVPEYRALVDRISMIPEFKAVSPRINIAAAAFVDERRVGAYGIGIDLALEKQYQDLDAILASGRFPSPGTSEAVLGVGLARELGVGIGDTATFLTQTRLRTSNAFTVDVVGLASYPVGQMNRTTFLLPLETAARYMRMNGAVGEILITSTARDSRPFSAAVQNLLDELGREDVYAAHWSEVSGGYSYMQFADVAYNFMALFFFVLGATVVINTTMMMIHERTHEIGTLAAIGMRGTELVRLFFLEAALLGLIGSLLGVVLGVAVVIPLQSVGINFGSVMEQMEGMSISSILYPVLNWRSTGGTFLFSFVVAAGAAYLPSRRAAKLKPVEALRA